MAQIEFVVPEAVTNFFTNPRVGDGVTGFTAVGSVRAAVLDRARWGNDSITVITFGAAVNEGVYATVVFGGGGAAAGAWSGSVYVRGAGTVRVRLLDNTNTVQYISDEQLLNDDRWIRMDVHGAIPAGSLDMRLYIETVGQEAVTFYVDGIQVEPNGYATTYVDGDRELEIPPHDGYTFFQWNGTRHASTSSRSADFRPGGKTEVIENVDARLFITDMDGTGMPPIDLHITQFASMDRAIVDSWKARPRVLNLHFFAHRDLAGNVCFPSDLSDLHEQRQKLETILKPDKALGAQPILMRYSDGHDSRKLEMFVYYDGGLEWSGDIRWPYMNDFTVRFLAVDPYWYEDTQDVATLTFGQEFLGDADFLVARIDGQWAEPGDTNGNVYKIAVHPISGDIYVGGAFTTIDGATPNTSRIARWDGAAWNSLGGAGNIIDDTVRAIDFLVDGHVIIGGEFTNVGGAASHHITLYNPDADTFSTVGAAPGLDDDVYDFAVDDDGFVYVVGLFLQDSPSVVDYNHVVRYSPAANTFAAMGGGPGLDDDAVCCSMDKNGEDVYIGGIFTTTTGGAANLLDSLTMYDFSADDFLAMGTGIDAAEWVIDILVTHDNRVYAVGEFDHIGFVDVGNVGVWNGREWYPLGVEGDGFTIDGGGVFTRALHENYKNLLFIGGDIDGATDAPLYQGFGSWDRSRFQHWDLRLPTNHVFTIATKGDDIWIGFDNAGGVFIAEIFTVDNVGRTITYPTLEIEGPYYIQWLENQTTGQIVRLDLDIQDGETVIFDFAPWNRFVRSTHRGNVIKSILADSDEFHLLPGENVIAMFGLDADDELGTIISLRWPIVHWSFDDLR